MSLFFHWPVRAHVSVRQICITSLSAINDTVHNIVQSQVAVGDVRGSGYETRLGFVYRVIVFV